MNFDFLKYAHCPTSQFGIERKKPEQSREPSHSGRVR